MEFLEKVAVSGLQEELQSKCPKDPPDKETQTHEPEDNEMDEFTSEKNNGGKLGGNMINESHGTDGTWRKASFASISPYRCDRVDSAHNNGGEVTLIDIEVAVENLKKDSTDGGITSFKVKEVLSFTGKPHSDDHFRYTVAAHHCIPGNAALKKSDLFKYMDMDAEGGGIVIDTEEGKTSVPLANNIGYNVNGSHNGVWLPGNYALNAKQLAQNERWRWREPEWRARYVAALVAKLKCQFHDTHSAYSDTVKKTLNNMEEAISGHIGQCDDCRRRALDKGVPPPYVIIRRLVDLSQTLRNYIEGDPQGWMENLITSDGWQLVMTSKISKDRFLKLYELHKNAPKG